MDGLGTVVVAELVPAIHVLKLLGKAWIPGSQPPAGPGMTMYEGKSGDKDAPPLPPNLNRTAVWLTLSLGAVFRAQRPGAG